MAELVEQSACLAQGRSRAKGPGDTERLILMGTQCAQGLSLSTVMDSRAGRRCPVSGSLGGSRDGGAHGGPRVGPGGPAACPRALGAASGPGARPARRLRASGLRGRLRAQGPGPRSTPGPGARSSAGRPTAAHPEGPSSPSPLASRLVFPADFANHVVQAPSGLGVSLAGSRRAWLAMDGAAVPSRGTSVEGSKLKCRRGRKGIPEEGAALLASRAFFPSVARAEWEVASSRRGTWSHGVGIHGKLGC